MSTRILAGCLLMLSTSPLAAQRVGRCAACHTFAGIFKSKADAVQALVRGVTPKKRVAAGTVAGPPIDPVFMPIQSERLQAKPDVYAVVPESEAAYNSVFGLKAGRKMTRAEIVEVQDARLSLAMTSRQKLRLATDADNGVSVESFIRNSRGKYAVIVGHNDQGLLRLPNGSIALKRLDELCASLGKRCFFVSCNSSGWVTQNPSVNKSISLVEAQEITFQIDRLLLSASQNKWTNKRLQDELTLFVDETKRSTGLELVVDNSGAFLVLVTLVGAYMMDGNR